MRRDKQEAQAQFNRRVFMLGGLGAAAFGGLSLRLYQLQVQQQDRYRLLSDDNQFNFSLQPPSRGTIFDRNGEVIAENRDSYRIFIVPEQSGDPAIVLNRLADFMPLSQNRRERILRDISRSPRFRPVTVAEDVDWETFSRVNLFLPDLPGITPDVGELRAYPMPQAFAHIVGYVQSAPEEVAGDDPLLRHPGFRIGRSGIEGSQDETLRGRAGQLKVEVNATGRVIRELPQQSVAATQGQNIHLSIDARIQRYATERLGAESGAAVCIDVRTGELIALVSNPSFDPNLFVTGISGEDYRALNENDLRPLYNKAIMGLYSPASTIKGAMALAALAKGVITPSERIFCGGSTRLGNREFHCWRRQGHGHVNLHDGIKTSCDLYFYEVAARMGIETMHDMATRLGLGELFDIGIPIPDRARGIFPNEQWKRARYNQGWSTGDTYNTGIGQGYTLVSPLQLAVMTARLATGKAITPTLLRRPDGLDVPDLGLNPDHVRRVHEAMVAVVHEPGGTSHYSLQGLGIDGVQMAGKTGTSQVYSITAEERARGVRSQDDLPWRLRDHGIFVGYAPASNPQYAVSVVIEHGGGGTRAAARPARDILRELVLLDPAGRIGPLPSDAQDLGES
ncbi:penicillin-binding protein 2 [Woodsholea maritima]|uniref:penicillin-binding protein 2 n=1 Tax=Woodsholea maritima TaxID=240237 RepID=UPI0003659CE6|nr:penicillin-binding protein 2 [Woodsholea maritima]